MDRRSEAAHAEPREQFVGAMQQALELTLTAHAQRLSALEGKSVEQTGKMVETMASLAAAVRDTGREQQAALVRVAESVAAQAAVLGRLAGRRDEPRPPASGAASEPRGAGQRQFVRSGGP